MRFFSPRLGKRRVQLDDEDDGVQLGRTIVVDRRADSTEDGSIRIEREIAENLRKDIETETNINAIVEIFSPYGVIC